MKQKPCCARPKSELDELQKNIGNRLLGRYIILDIMLSLFV